MLPELGVRDRSKPGVLIAAGIVCGMLAFSLLFAPILPVDNPAPAESPRLHMPEGGRPAPPHAQPPARQSLIAALMPASAPSWLSGGPGRASVASVVVAKAKQVLGAEPPRPPAGFENPGEPEKLKSAGDSAFKNSGKLQRIAAPAGGAATGASYSASPPTAKLGLVGSAVAAREPVDPREPRTLPGRPSDTTRMVKVGRRSPVAAASGVAAHGAVGAGSGGGSATTVRESSFSATGLARVPDAVAAQTGDSYRGPGNFTARRKDGAEDDAHGVPKELERPDVGTEMNASAVLSSFFRNLGSPAFTRRLQDTQDRLCTNAPPGEAECDLARICIEAGLYEECKRSLEATCAETPDPPRCRSMLRLKVPPDPPTMRIDPDPCIVTVGSCWNNYSVRFAEPGQTVTAHWITPAGRHEQGSADNRRVGSSGQWTSPRCMDAQAFRNGLDASHVGEWESWVMLGNGQSSSRVRCSVRCPAGTTLKQNPKRCE